MNLFKKVTLFTLSSIFALGFGVTAISSNTAETKVEAASAKANHNQFWIYDENKVGVKLKLTSISYESGYDKDDLVSWFNNFKGAVDSDFSTKKCNYTILENSASSFIVGQQTIVTGNHYGRDGDHRIYLFPKFVTSITCQAMKWNNSKTLGDAVKVSGGKRVIRGVYCNGGSSGDQYTGIYKDNSMNDYTRNLSYNQYTVTYYNGSTQLATETRVEYSLPTKLDATYTVAGKEFKGWYTSTDFTTAYTEKAISANTSIYARFASVNYIYFGFKGDEWTNLYVYGFDANEQYSHGPWPGSKLPTTAVAFGACFDTVNNYGLAKIPVYEGYPYVIIGNGKNNTDAGAIQTQTLIVTTGNYYTMNDVANATGSPVVGEAAKFVFDLHEAINKTANQSVCDLNAKTWVDAYNALSDDARVYASIATIATINYENEKGEDATANYLISEIITVLSRQIAANSHVGNRLVLPVTDSNTQPVIIIIALATIIGGCIAIIAIKRKHP